MDEIGYVNMFRTDVSLTKGYGYPVLAGIGNGDGSGCIPCILVIFRVTGFGYKKVVATSSHTFHNRLV